MESKTHNTSLTRGRLLIIFAAVLWSLSGIFKCILKDATSLRLGDGPVDDLAIAFYRPFFAGLFLLLTVRRQAISFRPMMAAMIACFAAMNITFVLALTGGTAANAILLQYTAPLWIYLAGLAWLAQ